MIRAKGVCFYNSSRAIVLEREDVVSQRGGRTTTKIDLYEPDPADTSAPPKGIMTTPAQRAVEEIRRHTGTLEKFLRDIDLQKADEERFDRLNVQNAALAQKIDDMGVWMNMIKEALQHYDEGELSARRFANEVDAAIKGWEAK